MTEKAVKKIPILVVEDEDLLRSNIVFSLQREGKYDVFEAPNAETAVEILKEKDFALVITDIRMEKMSGMELLSHVSENYKDTGVILMTAFGSESQRFEVFGRGGLRYLEKPFSLDHLVKTVDEVLENMFNSGFRTTLESVTLVDLIQLYCLNRATGLIEARAFNETGEIYLSQGRFVHARVGDVSGSDALLRMLEWEGGSCHFRRNVPPPAITIPNLTAEQVLIDCLRILDEKKADKADGNHTGGSEEAGRRGVEKALSALEKEGRERLAEEAITEEEKAAARKVMETLGGMKGLEKVQVFTLNGTLIPTAEGEVPVTLFATVNAGAPRLVESVCGRVLDVLEMELHGGKKVHMLRLKFGYLACLGSGELSVRDLIGALNNPK